MESGAVVDLIYCGTDPPVGAEGTQLLLSRHSAVWCPPMRMPFEPNVGQRLWLVWRPADGGVVHLLGRGIVRENDAGAVRWTEAVLPGVRQAARGLGYGGPTNMSFLRLDEVEIAEARPAVGLGQVPAGLSRADTQQTNHLEDALAD